MKKPVIYSISLTVLFLIISYILLSWNFGIGGYLIMYALFYLAIILAIFTFIYIIGKVFAYFFGENK